jgi:D-glycero-alpha-D-manno-heptose-7-phosphate kinase
MITSGTPLRVSFVGGGTDMGVFYRRYGGAVISTWINRHITIVFSESNDGAQP